MQLAPLCRIMIQHGRTGVCVCNFASHASVQVSNAGSHPEARDPEAKTAREHEHVACSPMNVQPSCLLRLSWILETPFGSMAIAIAIVIPEAQITNRIINFLTHSGTRGSQREQNCGHCSPARSKQHSNRRKSVTPVN